METLTSEVPAPAAVEEAPIQNVLLAEATPNCSDTSVTVDSASPVTSESRAAAPRRLAWAGLAPGALLLLGAGWLAAKIVKAVRHQQRELLEACREVRSAQEQLVAKERSLEQSETKRKVEQEARAAELSQQVADAQRELTSAREMCRQAATKLEQSMSDLSMTETELRAARAQLNTASRDLALTHAQLEATEGELGLTRSQNELMKREVDILRRQLREAGQQLESYILVSRGRKNGLHHDDDDTRIGRGADYEDDLAAAARPDWGY